MLLLTVIVSSTACLKSNDYFEDFSSTQPVADIPKASNLGLKTPAITVTLDSALHTVDLKTAVHISAKEHIGDVTVKLKVDKAAAQALIARVPATGFTDYRTNQVLPDSLITVPKFDAVIPNAGVFSVGDFVVQIKTDKMSKAAFNANKYVLALSIESASGYTVASNFSTIYYNVRVK